MTALAAFLLARLDEDQAEVRRNGTAAVGHRGTCIYEGGYEGTLDCDCGAVARVLADVAAKRGIVALAEFADEEGAEPMYLWTIRHLASVYADHPDYRAEWAPR